MMEESTLLQFLCPTEEPLRILSIESTPFLPRLRRMMPRAQIFAIPEFDEVAGWPEYRGLGVQWASANFRLDDLPYAQNFFDIVLAENCLEDAFDPYESTLRIGRHIKETGHLLTQFPNIRHWRVLEGLRRGAFPARRQHLYAKAEIVRLLNDALFKEIVFAPRRRDDGNPGKEWAAFGFEDYRHDLATEIWLVKASRSTAAVAALKSLYSRELRGELSRLLHRIEYGVCREQSLDALWALCRREMVFAAYLADFVQEATSHQTQVFHILLASAQAHGMEDFAQELQERTENFG